MTNEEIQEIDLEDLIKDTEQKILNNEYYEDVTVNYKGGIVRVRIKPISQSKFVQLTRNKATLESVEFNTHVLQECIINKYNNERFTRQQINDLFTGGLATALTLKCLEVSGLTLDNMQANQLKKI